MLLRKAVLERETINCRFKQSLYDRHDFSLDMYSNLSRWIQSMDEIPLQFAIALAISRKTCQYLLPRVWDMMDAQRYAVDSNILYRRLL